MEYIANILTNRKFSECELYNVVSDKKDLIEGIPTLVIGWEYTKKKFPEANILDWQIDNKTFWVFGNRERRQRYEETIIKFRKYVINNLVKSIKYKYISLIHKDENHYRLNSLFKNECELNIYIKNDMIYIASNDKKIVYGVSLKECDYLGIDRKEVLKRIYQSKNNIINTKDSLSVEIKSDLRNHDYIIPCLY